MKHFQTLKQNIKEDLKTWLSRLVFALGPFVGYVMAEILNGNDPFTDLELWRAAWNIAWYIAVFAFFWLVTGSRRSPGAALGAVFAFGFALVNHYVLRFRGTALFPIDILSWRTAANVAAAYDYAPDRDIWIAAGILAAYLLCVALTARRGAKRPGWPLRISVAAVLAGFLLSFFCTGMLPHFNIYAEQWLTQKNGFIFNFMTALRYSFASEPEGYELEEIEEFKEEFMAELDSRPEEEPATEPVNIILIMNESWADLSIYENYSIHGDTMDGIDNLEGAITGALLAPVAGGGTANVEYEVLTGNPYIFLPGGTVAYQLFIDSDAPSLATLADDAGSESYAFHPYLASGWNRTQAYEYLGFDYKLFDEDVKDPEYVRDYISDSCSFDVITDITDAEAGGTFVFNVTMQNHSGYNQEWTNLPYTLYFTGDLAGESSAAEQYLNLANLTDQAFIELTEYYEESGEPTIIAMFGDHQPPLSEEFFDLLLGEDSDSLSDEERMIEYVVPFVVWANYDLPEQDEDILLSCNYFGVLLAELAGLEMTPYMEFVAEMAEELPVLHRLGFVTGDGEFVDDRSQLDPEEQEMLSLYEKLSYNYLFDREQGDEFFEGRD